MFMKTNLKYYLTAIFASFFLLHTAHAATMPSDSIDYIKSLADSAYAKEDFDTAMKYYLRLAEEGESSVVYYNLACTFYRQDNIAKAVLWFERALRLDPSDDDIRFNLTMARNKTVDRIIPRHEMFFASAWKSLMRCQSVSDWAYWGIFFFVLTLLLVLLYVFSSRIPLRKTGFFGAILCLILCLMSNILAYSLRSYNRHHSAGIVMEPAVTVRSTPTKSGTDLFVIHEGTYVEIRDDSMRDWAEIQIADGKVGWIEKGAYESI